jgi:hypothetical protein
MAGDRRARFDRRQAPRRQQERDAAYAEQALLAAAADLSDQRKVDGPGHISAEQEACIRRLDEAVTAWRAAIAGLWEKR